MTGPGPQQQPDRWQSLFDGHVCSLGYTVIDWIEAFCCHGPGDVQGDPVVLDDEWRAFVIGAYRLDPATGRRKVDAAVLSRGKGRAKALALDTPLPTPTGWTTMGEVQPGDALFDETGTPTTVLGVSEVYTDHDCYEVEFSDGERIVADAGHLWTVEELRRDYRQVTVDTAYLAEHRTTRADGACNFRLQMPGPLKDLPTADLPIDPYVLGVWLGDGNTANSGVCIPDAEVADELRAAGYRVEHRASYGPYGYWVFGLNSQLRALGVLGNKHVPQEYLRASTDQRLSLLQGLLDSDGTVSHEGRAGFTSKRERLADAVVELLATFGIKSAKREFRTKLQGRDCGPGWSVDFWPVAEVPVFRLTRKAERQRPRDPDARCRLADTRRIVAVRPVETVPTRCIAVESPSRLFLAGRRMVQTHNSELAGFIAVAEAFGQVRFDGWDADGQPVGRPVRSPLIKCLATEEEQAGNTFENVAFIAASWGPDVHPDIYAAVKGARQYQSATALYLPFGGEIRASTAGAASKDGGKETFAVADEVGLYVTRELRSMYATVARNLAKRKASEPWMLSTTTMYRRGEQSVAEDIFRAWKKGELRASTLVDHRQASGRIDLDDEAHTKKQLREVYGDAASWIDVDRIYRDMLDPTVCPDVATAARYYLNREMAGSTTWIAADVVERQVLREVVADGEAITVGFDGSLSDDSTVLIGCRVSDGFLFPLGIWERPEGPEQIGWEVDRVDVEATLDEAFGRYDVKRAYCDPHEWRSDIGRWSEKYEGRVHEWATNRWVPMDAALDRLRTDLINGAVWHSGNERFVAHFVNAAPVRRGRLTLVGKPSHDRKIDSVPAAALAYEARADVMAAPPPKKHRPARLIGF